MIVRANESLTDEGVSKLYEYAQDGLPILFPGGIPTRYLGANSTGAKIANQTMEKVKAFDNVHIVSENNLAATLQSLGIYPRASVVANRTWYPVWREDSKAKKSYLYMYNDAANDTRGQGGSSGSVTVDKIGQPYKYDQWTGDNTPIYNYASDKDTVTVNVSLAGNQTAVIGFHHDEAPKKADSAKLPSGAWIDTSSKSKNKHTVTAKYPCDSTAATSLTTWTLIVESWTAPSDIYDLTPDAAKSNATYHLTSLTSWRNTTDELRNVSGRGYYSTAFAWPPAGGSSKSCAGALLDLGAIVHTARASVNGHALPALDVTHAVADIGSLLRKGKNTVEIVVSTPLGNALRPLWNQVQTSGKTPPGLNGIDAPLEADYGLVMPVVVRPYCEMEVELVDA